MAAVKPGDIYAYTAWGVNTPDGSDWDVGQCVQGLLASSVEVIDSGGSSSVAAVTVKAKQGFANDGILKQALDSALNSCAQQSGGGPVLNTWYSTMNMVASVQITPGPGGGPSPGTTPVPQPGVPPGLTQPGLLASLAKQTGLSEQTLTILGIGALAILLLKGKR